MQAFEHALEYTQAGLSVLPIAKNGTKKPTGPWKEYQTRIADEQELREIFANGCGIGIICGAVSRWLQIVDFEVGAPLKDFGRRIREQLGDAFADALVLVATPSGGFHVYIRCPGWSQGNQKLAQKVDDDGRPKVMIETRGEGGYGIAPGSPAECHPTGKLYRLVKGSLSQIPEITPEQAEMIFAIARTFNEYFPQGADYPESGPGEQGTSRPGDEFNARGPAWGEILKPHGWQLLFERNGTAHWTRPGKDRRQGGSATTNHAGSDLMYVFSSNAHPFDNDTPYTKFAAHTLLNHGGDFSAAAKELRSQGYGALAEPVARPNGSPTSSAVPAAGEHLTDLGNARRLVEQHGKNIRYVHEWGGLVWDGQRWANDTTGAIERMAKETVKDIYVEASEAKDQSRRESLGKHAVRSESKARIRDMIELAKSEIEVVARPEQFDTDPWLLNCHNGTLDLHTGKLREHRKTDFITKLAPVDYDPEAKAPLWGRFLGQIMDDNQELISFLQRAVGYCLPGVTTEQVLFVFFGLGSNGKSTFLELVGSMLGDYAKRTPASTLLAHRGDRIPNDIARLQGARFVVATETEQQKAFNESLVKQLTGNDTVTARFLHKEFFEFRPQFKIILGTNHKPEIKGQDHAIWRRIRLVPFTVTIPDSEQDKVLAEKLTAELPGILTWAVQGCLQWQKEGLKEPQEVLQATLEYREESDVLAEWMEESCKVSDRYRATPADLYLSYRQWCEKSGVQQAAKNVFGTLLKERGFESTRVSSKRWWLGIAPKDPEGLDL